MSVAFCGVSYRPIKKNPAKYVSCKQETVVSATPASTLCVNPALDDWIEVIVHQVAYRETASASC